MAQHHAIDFIAAEAVGGAAVLHEAIFAIHLDRTNHFVSRAVSFPISYSV